MRLVESRGRALVLQNPSRADGCEATVCVSDRGKGVATTLLRHAPDVARERGARLIEAYPVPRHSFPSGKILPAFAWTGVREMFAGAGFQRHGRTGVKRQIYRLPGLRGTR